MRYVRTLKALASRVINHRIFGPDGNRAWWIIPAFGVVVIAMVWTATIWRLNVEQQLSLDGARHEIEGLAATFEQRTLRTIKNADVTALLLKDQFELQGKVDIGRAIAKGLIAQDAYLVVSVADASGRITTSTNPRAIGVSVDDRDYFRRHRAADIGLDISRPVKLRAIDKTAIQLTRRLNDRDGSFAGMVLLSVDPDFFTDFYTQAEFGTQGTLGLLGYDGIYRARRVGLAPASAPESSGGTILARVRDKPIGSFAGVSPLDGFRRLIAYRALRELPLIVVAGRSENEILADFYDRRRVYLWSTTAVSAAIVCFFAVISALALSLKQSRLRAWARARELKLASAVYETTADGIMVTDQDDRIVMVNAAFTKLSGFPANEVLGMLLLECPFRPIDLPEYAERAQRLLRDGHASGEVTRYAKDGSELSLWLTATVVYDDAGNIANFIGVFTDISAIKDSRRQLEAMARIDALTGLPNRRAFHECLARSIATARREQRELALLFIDLDGFKAINDRFGHETGDQMLQKVATMLNSTVRASDTVFRLGGDEFTMLLDRDVSLAHAKAVTERIIAAMTSLVVVNGCAVVTGASIGIAFYPRDGQDVDKLVSSADAAMYSAKKSGRSQYSIYAGERR